MSVPEAEVAPPASPLLDGRRWVTLGVAACLLGGAMVWKATRRRAAADVEASGVASAGPSPVTVIDDVKPLPDFRLAGTRGEVTRASLLGHWTLLYFGYTQCPDVCPTTLSALKAAFAQLGSLPRPRVLFVSVDPDRDTPALLREYMAAFDPQFDAATGDDQALGPLVRHLGVHYARATPGERGTYTVDHTAAVFLIDPQSRLKALIGHPPDPAQVAAQLQRLAR
ncbi:MAG: SCO family protein [Burkholderiaceae bacterium]